MKNFIRGAGVVFGVIVGLSSFISLFLLMQKSGSSIVMLKLLYQTLFGMLLVVPFRKVSKRYKKVFTITFIILGTITFLDQVVRLFVTSLLNGNIDSTGIAGHLIVSSIVLGNMYICYKYFYPGKKTK